MLSSKQQALRPLIESQDGVHLTSYLRQDRDLGAIKTQLRKIIDQAEDFLIDVMPADERKRFLEPLESLLKDAKILQRMPGNIGIFRNKDLFRILNIPIETVPSFHLASSFHIKPLLRWLQGDQEFLIMGIDQVCAHLYWGNQSQIKWLDSIQLPVHSERSEDQLAQINFRWLDKWILEFTKTATPKLFIEGDPSIISTVLKDLKYKNTYQKPISASFDNIHINESCLAVRKILRKELEDTLEKTLLEFRLADLHKRAKKNLFQIAKAVVQGKVRKLVVTDELSIFGKIDHKSGGISIHPIDLDHEDDCLLDDLAQMVLNQGGEVIVASRNQIPNGRPILAILNHEGEEFSKMNELVSRATLER